MIALFSCFVFLYACGNNEDNYPKAENSFDAGREFIDACLKGDFKKANFYMLQGAVNTERLTALEKDYKTKSSTDRMQYGSASIVVLNDETISDTLHIIHYRNSFDQVARKVKVIQKEGNWLVDFKYTFNGNL